jgi:peptidoglycan-associated lipoprotein
LLSGFGGHLNEFGNASSRLTEGSLNQVALDRMLVTKRERGGSGMFSQMRILQGFKLAAVLVVALSMGACANKNGMGGDGLAGAATPGSQQDFVVNVGDRVFFESDQTDLSQQAINTLEKQAQWLQQYNRYSFTIEGHADERGTREYNIALGAKRAQSVRNFLVSRGIDASRMRTISYGKERPVAVCNDISCWSQNRRAVIVLNASS